MERESTFEIGSSYPHNDEKGNLLSSSKLCTQVTSNFDSKFTGLLNDYRNDPELKEKQTFISKKIDESIAPIIEAEINSSDVLEDSVYSKLNQLEMRSSKVVNMFPQFHSKQFRSTLGQGLFEDAGEDPQMAKKIKIIRDLQNKISELQLSVKNPLTCQQYMQGIQRQIKLNFDSYYLEGKQINSDGADKSSDVELNEPKSPQLLSAFSKKNYFQDQIPLLVPKIVEIEVPVPVLKVVEANNVIIRRSRSEGELHSSIAHIIDKYDKKFANGVQHLYTYQQDEPQIMISKQEANSGLHLPLDSVENIQQQEWKDPLKRTDRSNISSTEELEKIREDTWNKNLIELNQEYLSQVQEMEQKSESHDHSRELMLESRNESDESVLESAIGQQIKKIKRQLEAKKVQVQQIAERSRQFEGRAIEKQIQLLQTAEKLEYMEEENKQLKEKEQFLQGELEKAEQTETSLRQRVTALQKQLLTVIEQKEYQIAEYQKTIFDKNEEVMDGLKANQELRNIVGKKQKGFESQLQESEAEMLSLKEELKYYKARIEEEGFHLDIEEASKIRDIIENKDQVVYISTKYKETVRLMKIQEEKTQKCIQQLKQENKKLQRKELQCQQRQEAIHNNIQELLCNLQKQTSTPNQKNYNSYQQGETEKNKSSTSQDRPLDAMMEKIVKLIKQCSNNIGREKQEKQRIANKLKGLNLYMNRQIEKVEEKSVKLEKQNTKYKRQAKDLASEVKRLQLKLKHVKSRLAESPMSSIHQVQNELLELQNKKLLEICQKSKLYSEELEQRLISKMNADQSMQQKLFKLIKKNKQQQTVGKQQFETQFKLIASRLKQQISKSDLCKGEFEKSVSQPPRNIRVASRVLTFTNRPSKVLPKSIMAPLPAIPTKKDIQASVSLEKLLTRKKYWTSQLKVAFISKLFNLCIELIKVTRKLFSLKPSQMMVSSQDGKVQIVIRRQFAEGKEQDDASLLYRAPEVLLGFAESQASYVWSVGVIIDQLLHGSLFYKKINQILSRKENYEVRQPQLPAGDLLKEMMKKNQKTRLSIEQSKTTFLALKC